MPAGPEALFAGKSNVIERIFEKLKDLDPELLADAQLRELVSAVAGRRRSVHRRVHKQLQLILTTGKRDNRLSG